MAKIVAPKFARVLLFGIYCFIAATKFTVAFTSQSRWQQSQDALLLNGTDFVKVPLLAFKISIEFRSISSPDILPYALTDYLLNRTGARSIELLHTESVEQVSNENPIIAQYNGSAVVSTEYGRLAQVLLQNEQRIALTDPILESVMRDYYNVAIFPYEGDIFVREIELMEAQVDGTASPQEFSDTVQSVAWYTIVIASAGGAAACATLLVFLTICVVTYRQFWKDQLEIWKYNVERERDLQIIVEGPNVTEDEAANCRLMNNECDDPRLQSHPPPNAVQSSDEDVYDD